MSAATATHVDLLRALEVRLDAPGRVSACVHEGYDIFGAPHGGVLMGLVGNAALAASGAPDLFTVTTHFTAKPAEGELVVDVAEVAGSRRFTSLHLVARQGERVILTALASVGDRAAFSGPTWTDVEAWTPTEDELSAPAGSPELRFPTAALAARVGLQLETATTAFAVGRTAEHALLRGRLAAHEATQATALVACDATPPALWNAVPPTGWVPTVELTAHVRARPVPGHLYVEVATHHVGDGFFEEDALVRDATGRVVVQSRQLARVNDPTA